LTPDPGSKILEQERSLKNVLRQPLIYAQCLSEMSTGLGLEWIRTIAKFVEFGLDPDCKTIPNLGWVPDLDVVNGAEMRRFCCEKAAFFDFFVTVVGLGLYI